MSSYTNTVETFFYILFLYKYVSEINHNEPNFIFQFTFPLFVLLELDNMKIYVFKFHCCLVAYVFNKVINIILLIKRHEL